MIDTIQLSRYKTNAVQGQRKSGSYYPNAYDNLFSNYLNSLYNNSPTHQCIIDDIAEQIVGLGFTCDDKKSAAKLSEFLTKKKALKIAKSLLVQESVGLEVRRNPLKDIKGLDPINLAHIRVSKMGEEEPVEFAYRKDWNPNSSLYSYRNTYLNSYNKEDDISLLYYYDSGTYNTPYGRPSYLSAADAIELEIAIYMMHNHGAQNGMFPSMIISKETSGDVELDKLDSARTQAQATGPMNAAKIITTYNRQGATPPVISTPNLSGIDKVYENQYQTAEIGILKAHRIPSSNLISGLNSKGSGFTSEIEELAYAQERMRVKIIEPRREQLLEILDPIFKELEIEGVYFKDVEEEVVIESLSIDKDPLDEFIELGEDEERYSDYEIANVMDVDYDIEDDLDKEVSELNRDYLRFATTGTAFPNAGSEQDGQKGGVYYLVRYRYAGDSTGKREFCRKMLAANKLYRKEDIIRMGDKPVNRGLGIKGAATYPIWEWKGGKYCHHKWERVTFVKKGSKKFNVRNTQANKLTESMADERGMNPKNPKIVSTRPIDTPTRGAYMLSKIQNIIKKWQ